ncbi:hypothetical protein [Xylanibacter muris]|uniref:DUF2500 family protein n=1 Tax=Xylanibacter muris TaxID=2736290 RepID=A0ABX2AJ16_9BACT|nr:hypothetical protein [Xylanibacter muris]NPD91098.1 hypothetical protein [Xylanibacter muris]
MKRNKIKNVLQIVAVVAGLCLGGYAYIIYERTLIDWWIPVGYGMLAALFTAPLCLSRWKVFTSSSQRWINGLCHVFFTATIVYSFFIIGNEAFSDSLNDRETTVSVTGRERVRRNTYRRIGRHRYVADGHRYNHYIIITPDGGKEKKLPLSYHEYCRIRKGDRITVIVGRGFFGYPVVKGFKK